MTDQSDNSATVTPEDIFGLARKLAEIRKAAIEGEDEPVAALEAIRSRGAIDIVTHLLTAYSAALEKGHKTVVSSMTINFVNASSSEAEKVVALLFPGWDISRCTVTDRQLYLTMSCAVPKN
jgi:hypothetical protein